jgi:hypothetical protein
MQREGENERETLKARIWKIRGIKRGLKERSRPLLLEEEDTKPTLIKFSETKK